MLPRVTDLSLVTDLSRSRAIASVISLRETSVRMLPRVTDLSLVTDPSTRAEITITTIASEADSRIRTRAILALPEKSSSLSLS